MNIILKNVEFLKFFTPESSTEKPRDNFVSRDDFGPYCTTRSGKKSSKVKSMSGYSAFATKPSQDKIRYCKQGQDKAKHKASPAKA